MPAPVDQPGAAGETAVADAAAIGGFRVPPCRLGVEGTHNRSLGGYCARSIENNLHWQLDVTFREDDSRIRDRNAAENFALLRRVALRWLKRHPGKGSVATKRYTATLDEGFLEEVVQGVIPSPKENRRVQHRGVEDGAS